MKEESIFLDRVGDSPWMRILQYYIEARDLECTLTDLLNANVSWGTINTIVPKLFKLGMIKKTRKIGRATLYTINKDNVASKHLIKLYRAILLESFGNVAKKMKVTTR